MKKSLKDRIKALPSLDGMIEKVKAYRGLILNEYRQRDRGEITIDQPTFRRRLLQKKSLKRAKQKNMLLMLRVQGLFNPAVTFYPESHNHAAGGSIPSAAPTSNPLRFHQHPAGH